MKKQKYSIQKKMDRMKKKNRSQSPTKNLSTIFSAQKSEITKTLPVVEVTSKSNYKRRTLQKFFNKTLFNKYSHTSAKKRRSIESCSKTNTFHSNTDKKARHKFKRKSIKNTETMKHFFKKNRYGIDKRRITKEEKKHIDSNIVINESIKKLVTNQSFYTDYVNNKSIRVENFKNKRCKLKASSFALLEEGDKGVRVKLGNRAKNSDFLNKKSSSLGNIKNTDEKTHRANGYRNADYMRPLLNNLEFMSDKIIEVVNGILKKSEKLTKDGFSQAKSLSEDMKKLRGESKGVYNMKSFLGFCNWMSVLMGYLLDMVNQKRKEKEKMEECIKRMTKAEQFFGVSFADKSALDKLDVAILTDRIKELMESATEDRNLFLIEKTKFSKNINKINDQVDEIMNSHHHLDVKNTMQGIIDKKNDEIGKLKEEARRLKSSFYRIELVNREKHKEYQDFKTRYMDLEKRNMEFKKKNFIVRTLWDKERESKLRLKEMSMMQLEDLEGHKLRAKELKTELYMTKQKLSDLKYEFQFLFEGQQAMFALEKEEEFKKEEISLKKIKDLNLEEVNCFRYNKISSKVNPKATSIIYTRNPYVLKPSFYTLISNR